MMQSVVIVHVSSPLHRVRYCIVWEEMEPNEETKQAAAAAKKVAANKLEALNQSLDEFLNDKDNQVVQVLALVEKHTRIPRKFMFLGELP